MTTMFTEMYTCAVCGAEKEFYGIASTNSFGSPDLDLRPPEMQRGTMSYWVQKCPKCGYVAGSISDDPGHVTKEWLKSKEYTHNDGMKFRSGLADQFYKFHKISLLNGKTERAFSALLHAAWACDDSKDAENAARCRSAAIPLLDKTLEEIGSGRKGPKKNRREDDDDKKDNLMLMKTDLLRRSGQFETLQSEYAARSFKNDIMNKILAFQLAKAAEKDTGCYTVQEAVEWYEKKGE